jgi:hypothetical protein
MLSHIKNNMQWYILLLYSLMNYEFMIMFLNLYFNEFESIKYLKHYKDNH